MDNGQIYDFVVTVLRKEKEGSALTPDRFNLMLKESMWEKANDEYRKYELSQIITDTLNELKTTETVTNDADGEVDLTSLAYDFWHPSAVYYEYDTEGDFRHIEIVTDLEWAYRITSELLKPDFTYPICKFTRNGSDDYVLKIKPLTNFPRITIDYLRKPAEPFYDYYYDANDELVYLAPGSSHTLQAGEEYRDGSVAPTLVNSISVELPFPEGERLDAAYMILQKLGIPVKEQMAVEYGAARESKEDQI